MMLSGNVSNAITGRTTIFKNTKHAATITAVSTLLTVMPATKYGNANIASVVMNHRNKIMQTV